MSLVSIFGFVLVLIAFIVVLVLVLLSVISKRRPSNSPPIAKVGIPLIGNYIEFASNPVAFIDKCQKLFGGIYTVPMLHKNLTFLIGPEVSAPFFQLNDDIMSQSEVYGFMTPVFGKGVVYDAEQKKRLQQMQTMAGALRSNNLKAYVPKIEMETRQYLKSWGDSGTVNLLDALSELTILTSSRCLHGDDVRENMFAEIARIYHDLDKGVTPLSFFFPYAPTAAHQLRDNARKEMVSIFSKVINARKKKGGDTSQATDILQVFIDMVYRDDGTSLSDDQVVGLLIAMLFAGQHTSSISSTWTAMFLLHHPECLQRFNAEQTQILGELNPDTPLDFDRVNNMEYLQNCVKESLRMYPPLIMLMRMALSDVETSMTVNGEKKSFIIPKGDIVVTSPAVASRLENVFTKPDTFDPDRFNAERNEQKTPYAYLGFGGGRHACLGQQFGLLQVKTIVSILFRTYKFELVDKEFPEPDYTAMVVGPKNHVTVRYTKIR
jgi:sterol 14-demethylase